MRREASAKVLRHWRSLTCFYPVFAGVFLAPPSCSTQGSRSGVLDIFPAPRSPTALAINLKCPLNRSRIASKRLSRRGAYLTIGVAIRG